ncbi:UDP-2,3-diacylglucosamine diphosphatase LpxI domain-containing protein [Hyphococcus sp.]|uniref:UDP-2,3-diacylglucosamine diphosphatase LpxI domain-containing protein n=1 Tax=Hyphococcus sp. TaxID=2038636 RepID=UPI003CCBEC08
MSLALILGKGAYAAELYDRFSRLDSLKRPVVAAETVVFEDMGLDLGERPTNMTIKRVHVSLDYPEEITLNLKQFGVRRVVLGGDFRLLDQISLTDNRKSIIAKKRPPHQNLLKNLQSALDEANIQYVSVIKELPEVGVGKGLLTNSPIDTAVIEELNALAATALNELNARNVDARARQAIVYDGDAVFSHEHENCGTDELLEIVAAASFRGPERVLVKLCPDYADPDFDPPVLHPKTIALAANAKISRIVMDARFGVIAHRAETITECAERKITLFAADPRENMD